MDPRRSARLRAKVEHEPEPEPEPEPETSILEVLRANDDEMHVRRRARTPRAVVDPGAEVDLLELAAGADVDPGAGVEFDPLELAAGEEVDPAAGAEVDAGAGVEVDPLELAAGAEVDAGAGVEVDPLELAAGAEVDAGAGVEVDPLELAAGAEGAGAEVDPGDLAAGALELAAAAENAEAIAISQNLVGQYCASSEEVRMLDNLLEAAKLRKALLWQQILGLPEVFTSTNDETRVLRDDGYQGALTERHGGQVD